MGFAASESRDTQLIGLTKRLVFNLRAQLASLIQCEIDIRTNFGLPAPTIDCLPRCLHYPTDSFAIFELQNLSIMFLNYLSRDLYAIKWWKGRSSACPTAFLDMSFASQIDVQLGSEWGRQLWTTIISLFLLLKFCIVLKNSFPLPLESR